ncbi:hypothetical protein LCGC14_2245240 [marine sediment metagenome]|uniref:RNA polymerase sigma-70 region 4 domain-containing protein n=1 Tax=marine sediment metagenome TaxID=412755 RepID=A0A0F9D3Y2_9ZZZZ
MPETALIYDGEQVIVDMVAEEELRSKIDKMLDRLKRRNARVYMVKRYGLDGREPMTYRAIGEEFGLTSERIRQVIEASLRQLRHPKNAIQLKAYLYV